MLTTRMPSRQVIWTEIALGQMPDRQDEHAILANRVYRAMGWFPPKAVNELPDLKGKLTRFAGKRTSLCCLSQAHNRADETIVPLLGLRRRTVFGPLTSG